MNMSKLLDFIHKAGLSTYAGGGEREKNPERKGFTEIVYQEGDYYYRDSWTGYIRSRGMELVRYQGEPIWSSLYGGGMVEGHEKLAYDCFEFLKKAMSAKDSNSQSTRGPEKFSDRVWSYSYTQEGDKTEFSGYEEIKYKGELVFFHRVIGGLIRHRNK